MLLHCGPAIEWSDVCDPLRRSMRAATVSRAGQTTVEEADRMLADGTVMLEPGYRHDTVLAHGECHRPVARRSLSSTTPTVAPGRSRRSTRDRGDRLVRS